MTADWIEHRREDGERVGWIRLVGESCAAIDLLGREFVHGVDGVEAEEALEQRGLAFLAEPWQLCLPDGRCLRVRIIEVSTSAVVVREDDFGAAAAVGADMADHHLPFPAPAELTPLS